MDGPGAKILKIAGGTVTSPHSIQVAQIIMTPTRKAGVILFL